MAGFLQQIRAAGDGLRFEGEGVRAELVIALERTVEIAERIEHALNVGVLGRAGRKSLEVTIPRAQHFVYCISRRAFLAVGHGECAKRVEFFGLVHV